jgi:plastocyanin
VAAFVPGLVYAQAPFRAKVTIDASSARPVSDNANVVVWLTPLTADPVAPEPKRATLAQHNKQFEPHLLVIPVGSTVDFPNKDPFFHNVFSLYKGKRFDLGLYEAGKSRAVRFDRPGVSFIFCNIHPEMSAVVVALPTPYYGVSNAAGDITIPDVPPGRYRLQVWYERSNSEALAADTREITLPADSSVSLHVRQTVEGPILHKNKYGKDYDKSNAPYNP